MFKINLFSLLLVFGFIGCSASYQALTMGTIDKKQKSITVPSVGDAIFEIKSELVKYGWKVKIGNAELSETGIHNSKIDTNTKIVYDTRYRLYLTTRMSSNSNLGITTFNLSVVDNISNEEIINMVGNREEYVRYSPIEIAQHLIQSLNEIEQ